MYSKTDYEKCKLLTVSFEYIEDFKFSKYLESVGIWYVDISANDHSKIILKNNKKLFFYLFGFLAFFILLMESLIRVLFNQKIKKFEETDIGYVSFARSHELVLEKIIKNNNYIGISGMEISSNTFRNIFNYSNKICIDRSISFNTILHQIKNTLSFLYNGRNELIQFSNFINPTPSIKNYLKLMFKIEQSIRFETWTNEFFCDKVIKNTYLGNDTCYRAFWIIDNFNSGKTSTIQHGIPENIIQYYSISDYFFCWDLKSFEIIYKNPNVKYKIIGYPKEKIISPFPDNSLNSILIISTKIEEENDCLLVKDLYNSLNNKGLSVKIKLHPIEKKSIIKNFANCKLFRKEDSITQFKYFIILGSTFSIDLIFSGLKIIPISFNLNSTFSIYFDAKLIRDFIEDIKSTPNSEMISFLNSLQIDKTTIKCFDMSILNLT